MCLEDSSPKASTPEGKFSYVKSDSPSAYQSSCDQQLQTTNKDTLETIIEGPLESIAEVENVEECDTNVILEDDTECKYTKENH